MVIETLAIFWKVLLKYESKKQLSSGSGDLEKPHRIKAKSKLFKSMRKMVDLGKAFRLCLFDLFLPACYCLTGKNTFC